jgi:hypothetical protein
MLLTATSAKAVLRTESCSPRGYHARAWGQPYRAYRARPLHLWGIEIKSFSSSDVQEKQFSQPSCECGPVLPQWQDLARATERPGSSCSAFDLRRRYTAQTVG